MAKGAAGHCSEVSELVQVELHLAREEGEASSPERANQALGREAAEHRACSTLRLLRALGLGLFVSLGFWVGPPLLLSWSVTGEGQLQLIPTGQKEQQ